jgi:hypothetical protein
MVRPDSATVSPVLAASTARQRASTAALARLAAALLATVLPAASLPVMPLPAARLALDLRTAFPAALAFLRVPL